MNYWMILIPVFTAFAGWLTIWIAWKLLFYPKNPIKFAGRIVQGIIPRKKRTYAAQIAHAVNKEFLSSDGISRYLSDVTILNKIRPELENHIDHFLRIKLKQTMPVVGMLIGDRTINQLKELFMQELELLFPTVMSNYAGHLREEVFVEKLVQDKLMSYTSEEIRAILKQALSKELLFLKMLAVVVGTVIGLFQLAIIFIFIE
jgi:uncharacterized membrane protein YheB (UPF0754 family)